MYYLRKGAWEMTDAMFSKRIAGIVAIIASVAFGSHGQNLSIIPKPVSIERRSGFFTISRSTRIVAENGAEAEATKLIDALAPAIGFQLQRAAGHQHDREVIRLELREKPSQFGDEAYELDVSRGQIAISARRPTGLFYGMQTLLQLLPPKVFSGMPDKSTTWNVPCVKIVDYPRFKWRGLLVDPARHFIPKKDLLRFIDTMALHKFNSLQIHLTDDQGWRIEIRKYPKLTQVGAWRGGTAASTRKTTSGKLCDTRQTDTSGLFRRSKCPATLGQRSARTLTLAYFPRSRRISNRGRAGV